MSERINLRINQSVEDFNRDWFKAFEEQGIKSLVSTPELSEERDLLYVKESLRLNLKKQAPIERYAKLYEVITKTVESE